MVGSRKNSLQSFGKLLSPRIISSLDLVDGHLTHAIEKSLNGSIRKTKHEYDTSSIVLNLRYGYKIETGTNFDPFGIFPDGN